MRHAILAGLALANLLAAQGPTVVSTSPARHGAMGPFDAIDVTFTLPIDATTLTQQSFSVFGRWTGAVTGTLSLNATSQVVTFRPLVPLLLGDFVRVELANTITAVGGAPLTGGFHFQVHVGSAPGSGVFQQVSTINFRQPGEGGISTYGIHAGDVDRDGTPDITAINEISHDIRVFKSDGCGAVGAMTLVPDGQNWPSPHESADFNRDGWMDLVTGDYLFGNLSVFMNDGAGNYLPPLTLLGNSYIRSVVAGDFDGDGYPDIAAGNGSRTMVWLNDGTGTFLPPAAYNFQGSAEMNVVDANEDGWWDFVGSNLFPGECWVLLGNGDGTFSPNSNLTSFGAEPFASFTADINGDGHVDVGYACLSPDTFKWLFGDGAGNFTLGGSLPAGSYPTSIHMADLEGDGDMDAVLSHYFSADFYVYANNGSGGFGTPVILPAVAGASCTTIADFDRDGDLDIMGADEIVDIGILFAQDGPAPISGLQPATCDAALRINQRADGAGFGGTQAVPVRIGSDMAVTMSGEPSAFGILCLGTGASTSFSLGTWGLINLDIGQPLLILTGALLDQHGEMVVPLGFPASAPIGASLALQALMLSPAAETLSNPMRFVLVP